MTKKKIKIVILSVNFPLITKKSQYLWGKSGGGAENQILLWVKNLIQIDKFQIYIISKRHFLKEKSHIMIGNLNLTRIFAPNKLFTLYFLIRSFLTVLNINSKERINIIHINPPPISLILTYFIKKLLKISTFYKFPTIFSKSLFTSNYYKLSQPLLLNMTKSVDKIQCVSSQILKSALFKGFKHDQLAKIPNGINISPYMAISRNNKKKIKKLLFIGRFVKEKGIILLIEAFKEVVSKHSDLTLSLYGQGPERKKIAQLIEKLHLQEKIRISHFTSEEEKLKILQDHDLFILPSFFEGLSNALLEALSSGMPVLVSDIPANKELIKDEYTGIFFKNGDEDSLKMKIIYCLNNSEKLWILGANARKFCKSNFDIGVIQRNIFEVYNKLIKNF